MNKFKIKFYFTIPQSNTTLQMVFNMSNNVLYKQYLNFDKKKH